MRVAIFLSIAVAVQLDVQLSRSSVEGKSAGIEVSFVIVVNS